MKAYRPTKQDLDGLIQVGEPEPVPEQNQVLIRTQAASPNERRLTWRVAESLDIDYEERS